MQLLLWNVVDRDFRDILYDHRVTSSARQVQHGYFTESWLTVTDWTWPDPSLATQLSNTVPVMMLECDSGSPETCQAVADHVQAAMGIEPRHCSRRGGMMWSSQVLYTRSSGDVSIRFFANGQELTQHKLTASAG